MLGRRGPGAADRGESIAEGVPVDMREAVTGLDEDNAVLAAAAVLRAAGHRGFRGAVSGER